MKKFIVLLLTAFIVSCAGMPSADTNEKKLAAAEITWKNVLKTIDTNIERLSADQKSTVAKQIPEVENAMEAAHIALSLANDAEFTDKMTIINSGISVLRSILVNIEETSNGKQLHYVKRDHSFGFGFSWAYSYERDSRAFS